MSDTEAPVADLGLPALPPPFPQPPYAALATAWRSEAVQDIAEMAGMRVAMAVLQAQGGRLSADEPEPDEALQQKRATLALRVMGRRVQRELLTMALMQAPDVAAAVAADPSNPSTALMRVDVAAAWVRNWSDFAQVIQE